MLRANHLQLVLCSCKVQVPAECGVFLELAEASLPASKCPRGPAEREMERLEFASVLATVVDECCLGEAFGDVITCSAMA